MGTRLFRSLYHQRHDLSACLQSGQRGRCFASGSAVRPDPVSPSLTPPSSSSWRGRFLATAGVGAAAAAVFLGGRSDSDAPRARPLQSREPPSVPPSAAGDGAVMAASSDLQQLTRVKQPHWTAEFVASQPLQVCASPCSRTAMATRMRPCVAMVFSDHANMRRCSPSAAGQKCVASGDAQPCCS